MRDQTANSDTVWTNTAVNPAANASSPITAATATSGSITDGQIGATNVGYLGMDGNDTTTATVFKKSYYISVFPAVAKKVIGYGVYTLTFTLTDSAGNLIGSVQTLKLDFVATSVNSGASLALATIGTFVNGETVGYTTAKYARATLTNRDSGVVRLHTNYVI
jgi:hypothetical protein